MLRHRHVVHGLSCHLATISSRLIEVRWGVLFVLLSHSLHLMTLGERFAGFTECRKKFLDFKRLSAGFSRTKRGLSLFLLGLVYSSTYISCDARCHNSRKQIQFLYISLRHPVIARHALLSYESSL